MSIILSPSTYEFEEFSPSWNNFRAYTFTFLIFTEWDWYFECLSRLTSCECKFFAISPLHDQDVKEDGTPMKPHYHCIVRFSNAHSAYQLCKDFLLTCMPEKVEDFSKMCRYLVHNDNPEKYSYNIQDVKTNNFSLFDAQFHNDLFDELNFLSEVLERIRRREFLFELEISIWANSNGFGRFLSKYRYQIHADFCATKFRDSDHNEN